MLRTLMAFTAAAAILAGSADAFAWGGGGGGNDGGGGGAARVARASSSSEYSSTPYDVPEPGAIVLLVSAGAVGLAFWARRRK